MLLIALLKVIDRGMGIISLAMVSQPSFMLKESNRCFVAQVAKTKYYCMHICLSIIISDVWKIQYEG